MSLKVVVFDYGFGNVRSACRALEAVGASVSLTNDFTVGLQCDRLVVPGVGAFGACVDALKAVRGDEIIRERVAHNVPTLGICVGHQVLFNSSSEQFNNYSPPLNSSTSSPQKLVSAAGGVGGPALPPNMDNAAGGQGGATPQATPSTQPTTSSTEDSSALPPDMNNVAGGLGGATSDTQKGSTLLNSTRQPFDRLDSSPYASEQCNCSVDMTLQNQQMNCQCLQSYPSTLGLNLIAGHVAKVDAQVVPHMGWNTVEPNGELRLLKGIKRDERFYFVHSYAVHNLGVNEQLRTNFATTKHENYQFVSLVEQQMLFGTQFHPEKSGATGLKLLSNFLYNI